MRNQRIRRYKYESLALKRPHTHYSPCLKIKQGDLALETNEKGMECADGMGEVTKGLNKKFYFGKEESDRYSHPWNG